MGLDLRCRRNLGRILDDAFSLYGRRAALLAGAALAVAIPVDALVLGIGLGWFWKDWDSRLGYDEVLPVMLADFIVTVLVSRVTVQAVVDEADGVRRSIVAATESALKGFATLAVPMLAVGIALVLGMAVFVVPALLVAVFWGFVPQTVVVERTRGLASLRRSAEVVAGNGWRVLGIQLAVGLVVGVGLVLVELATDAIGRAADSVAITLVSVLAAQVVALPVLTAAMTLLYFDLRVGRGEDRDLPGRTPWERRLADGWLPPV